MNSGAPRSARCAGFRSVARFSLVTESLDYGFDLIVSEADGSWA
jgi:hypothetical protein